MTGDVCNPKGQTICRIRRKFIVDTRVCDELSTPSRAAAAVPHEVVPLALDVDRVRSRAWCTVLRCGVVTVVYIGL